MADDIEPLVLRRFRRNLEAVSKSPKGNLCIDCGHVKHNELGYCQIGQCSCQTGTTYSSVATILLRDLPDLTARHDADLAAAKAAGAAEVIAQVEAVTRKIEATHHLHGEQCLCGFSSAVSRARTEHITGHIRAALTTGGEG